MPAMHETWTLRIKGPAGARSTSYRTYHRAMDACGAFLWMAFWEAAALTEVDNPFPGSTSLRIYRAGSPILTVRHSEAGVSVDTGRGPWSLGRDWHRVCQQLADIVTAVGQIHGWEGDARPRRLRAGRLSSPPPHLD